MSSPHTLINSKIGKTDDYEEKISRIRINN